MLEVAPGWIRVCDRGELLGVCMCTHLSLWSTYNRIVIILFEMPFLSTRSSLVLMQICISFRRFISHWIFVRSHKAWVSSVRWSPTDPFVLASTSHDGTLKVIMRRVHQILNT